MATTVARAMGKRVTRKLRPRGRGTKKPVVQKFKSVAEVLEYFQEKLKLEMQDAMGYQLGTRNRFEFYWDDGPAIVDSALRHTVIQVCVTELEGCCAYAVLYDWPDNSEDRLSAVEALLACIQVDSSSCGSRYLATLNSAQSDLVPLMKKYGWELLGQFDRTPDNTIYLLGFGANE